MADFKNYDNKFELEQTNTDDDDTTSLPFYKNKKFKLMVLIGVFAFLVVIIICVCIYVLGMKKKDEENKNESIPPQKPPPLPQKQASESDNNRVDDKKAKPIDTTEIKVTENLNDGLEENNEQEQSEEKEKEEPEKETEKRAEKKQIEKEKDKDDNDDNEKEKKEKEKDGEDKEKEKEKAKPLFIKPPLPPPPPPLPIPDIKDADLLPNLNHLMLSINKKLEDKFSPLTGADRLKKCLNYLPDGNVILKRLFDPKNKFLYLGDRNQIINIHYPKATKALTNAAYLDYIINILKITIDPTSHAPPDHKTEIKIFIILKNARLRAILNQSITSDDKSAFNMLGSIWGKQDHEIELEMQGKFEKILRAIAMKDEIKELKKTRDDQTKALTNEKKDFKTKLQEFMDILAKNKSLKNFPSIEFALARLFTPTNDDKLDIDHVLPLNRFTTDELKLCIADHLAVDDFIRTNLNIYGILTKVLNHFNHVLKTLEDKKGDAAFNANYSNFKANMETAYTDVLLSVGTPPKPTSDTTPDSLDLLMLRTPVFEKKEFDTFRPVIKKLLVASTAPVTPKKKYGMITSTPVVPIVELPDVDAAPPFQYLQPDVDEFGYEFKNVSKSGLQGFGDFKADPTLINVLNKLTPLKKVPNAERVAKRLWTYNNLSPFYLGALTGASDYRSNVAGILTCLTLKNLVIEILTKLNACDEAELRKVFQEIRRTHLNNKVPYLVKEATPVAKLIDYKIALTEGGDKGKDHSTKISRIISALAFPEPDANHTADELYKIDPKMTDADILETKRQTELAWFGYSSIKSPKKT